MHITLIIALVIATAALFTVLGYLFARHRTESRDHHHTEERHRLRTDLKLAEEQRDQARAQADELRTERDEAQRSQRDRESAWSELTTRLNTVSEERGRLETDRKATGEELRKTRSEAEVLKKSLEDGRRRIQELEDALVTAEKDKAALEAVIGQHKERAGDYETELTKLRTERSDLEKHQAEVAAAQKELEQVREKHTRLQTEQVEATVAKMLKDSKEELTTTADEKLGTTTKAVTEKLQELGLHLREFDGQRTKTEAELGQQLKNLARENALGRAQTEALVKVLRKPQVRGQWGEMHLKKTVELANLHEHVDFKRQVTVEGEEGSLRPDMTIELVNGHKIVVDAKVSLDAFLNAVEADDDAEHDTFMDEHATHVRKHVDELATKEYFTRVAGSPDFVVMFLPNEALLQAALDKRPDLHEYALNKRVVIATPTILIPVLRVIGLSWEEEKVRENAENIQKLGRDVYDRLTTLSGHLTSLGKHLDQSVEYYNKTIGSLERSVLPAARRFPELGVSTTKDLQAVDQVVATTRSLKAPELVTSTTTSAETDSVEAEPLE